MRRREFIKVIAGSAAAWPLAARAQQPLMPVVGFLNAASAEGYTRQLTAFLKGLGEAGYVDGRNVTIEYRWADGRSDRLQAMVADLVQRQVAVIAATSTPAALAAKASTTTVPIVFETGADPVRLGLVANLNRPGGNITGVTQLSQEVAPKRLQMLHELLPMATSIALLINPSEPTAAETQSRDVLSAARNLGLELHVLNASSESDLDGVFAEVTKMRVGGLVIGGSPFFTSRTKQLGALALRHAVPTVYSYREFAMAGGLLSYGADIADAYHLVGNYTGRILKGDKPGDLPIQQATTKVEMYINLKTAKALGVSIPNTLIGRADEVIE
ncbi:MAG: ABC transporter substrate-binding protein [Pseudolabrys sp.]